MIKFSFKPSFLLDIDKTIVNTSREITPRVKKAIKNLRQQGFKVALCTGRPYATVDRELLDLFDHNDVHVLSGGAELTTTSGQVLFVKPIASDKVREIYFKVEQLGGEFFSSQDRLILVNQAKYRYYLQKFEKNRLLIPDETKEDWQANLISVNKINNSLRAYLQSLTDLNVIKLVNYRNQEYYDLTAHGVTKAFGAEKWAAHYHLDLKHIVAIGDSDNDLEVAQAVGYGIAMGNASDRLKAVAVEVIDHVDNDGLAKYLEEIARTY